MSWLIRNSDFGLNDVEWLDIYDYLSEFKKEEMITFKGKSICILNISKLEKIAHGF